MRDSFVFHSEYIADLPDEYKGIFAMYTINYALNNERPPIAENTLEWALWIKITRRIDQEREKYEVIKVKRAAAGKKHKGNQYTKAEPKQEAIKKEASESESKTPTENEDATERKEIVEQQEPKEKLIEKPKTKTFKKPTIEEVEAYCTERENNVDAQSFCDFYESKGWKVGAVKMKDWKASIRTWEGRQKTDRVHQKTKDALWGNESDIPDDIINTF